MLICLGVGSAGVAALEMNRRFIGIEIDNVYFNAAKARIEKSLSTKDENNVPRTISKI